MHTSTISATDTYTHACTYGGYSNTHTHVYRHLHTCALPVTHSNHVILLVDLINALSVYAFRQKQLD